MAVDRAPLSAFLSTVEEERLRARRQMQEALAAGDESGRAVAQGRLADLQELLLRSVEPVRTHRGTGTQAAGGGATA